MRDNYHTILLARNEMGIQELNRLVSIPSDKEHLKAKNFNDIRGYAGYVSGREKDRNKLYIKDVYPVRRKKDNAVFGYSVKTQSIGSGKESRMTVFKNRFDEDPIKSKLATLLYASAGSATEYISGFLITNIFFKRWR